MKVFVADDDMVSRKLLETQLGRWSHEAEVVADGTAAWERLSQPDAPSLVILDWMMPGLDGPEICRRVRAQVRAIRPYIILLTAKGLRDDIVAGLDAGADDYVIKPFDQAELKARLIAGIRILNLQQQLAQHIHELEVALTSIKTLQGLLPICAWCMKVRNEKDYWEKVEMYVTRRTDARFTHSICPECMKREMKQLKPQST